MQKEINGKMERVSYFGGDPIEKLRPDVLLSSGFDGKKAGSAKIATFQKYANSKGYTPKLVVDGKYGAKTEAAIKVFGDKYDSLLNTPLAEKEPVSQQSSATPSPATVLATTNSASENTGTNTPTAQTKTSTAGVVSKAGNTKIADTSTTIDTGADSAGMSTGKKVWIGLGIATLLGIAAFIIIKKRKK